MMGKMSKIKRSRLKLCIFVDLFLAVITVYAMNIGMASVASTSIAGILSITTIYICGDSYRKSDNSTLPPPTTPQP